LPHNRRTFLKTAGLATAVASTAPLSLSLHEGPGFAPSRAGAAPGGFAAGKFALELDGKAAGFLPAVQGGNVVAEVLEFTSGTDGILQKELGDVHYEEITMLVGLGMDTAFWDWVGHMVDRDPIPMDGAILFADMDSNVVRRMEFKKAWLSEVSLPALDAASNEAGLLTIKFRPESTALNPPGGKLPNLALAKQKTWLASNFRIPGGRLALHPGDQDRGADHQAADHGIPRGRRRWPCAPAPGQARVPQPRRDLFRDGCRTVAGVLRRLRPGGQQRQADELGENSTSRRRT